MNCKSLGLSIHFFNEEKNMKFLIIIFIAILILPLLAVTTKYGLGSASSLLILAPGSHVPHCVEIFDGMNFLNFFVVVVEIQKLVTDFLTIIRLVGLYMKSVDIFLLCNIRVINCGKFIRSSQVSKFTDDNI